MSPDLKTGAIIFCYAIIALMAVITGVIVLFCWELIQSYKGRRK
jgi:hypothetical protein